MPVKLSSLHIPEKPPGLLNKCSWVYMICSGTRCALYTGVTADLYNRVFQHKNELIEGFTKKYKCHRLVYYESFAYISEAIAREKEIKGWRREKKDALVATMNPQWKDLSEGWYRTTLGFSNTPEKMLGPSHLTRLGGSGGGMT